MIPLRERLADDFLASARDMGADEVIDAALRVWWAVRFPRTRPATAVDWQLFREWQNHCNTMMDE